MDLNKQESKLEDRIALKRVRSQEKFKKIMSQKDIDSPAGNPKNSLKVLIENNKNQKGQ